ncbi:MAG: class I SAM-dependent methyltransferase [Sedimentisphaerales bacterium]|nr:class I SAM-dependent methyltransferase [Sedimentisphaerales bacterium]
MDERYWDKAGEDYDGEIFSVLEQDRNEVVCSYIRRLGSGELTAGDFGCGVGKFLPVLAENFGRVLAVDLSSELLAQARENCKGLDNITYARKDLSSDGVKLETVDFALSVNVAIMMPRKIRVGIINTIARHLRKSGHLLMVVPSLESALFADWRLLDWNINSGMGYDRAVAASLAEVEASGQASIRHGAVEIDGVPTKHYLKEELEAFFADGPLDVVSIEKVEYSWKTEFESPPKWMKGPYPWDWAVLLKPAASRFESVKIKV